MKRVCAQHHSRLLHMIVAQTRVCALIQAVTSNRRLPRAEICCRIRSNGNGWSCACSLRIIVSLKKPDTMPPLHHWVRGACHDCTPFLLPSDGSGTPVVMRHAALRLAQPMHCDATKVSRVHQATASTHQRARTVCGSHPQTPLRC